MSNPDTAQKTIAIIGAGIVGISTAIWLQRDGHKVIVIDRLGPGEGTSYGNGGVLASCAIVPVTGPGLMRKAPKMLFDPNQPLFMKWGYLPKLVPWLAKYLSHANAPDTKRIAAALAGVVPDSLSEHQALSKGTGAEKWVVPTDYLYVYNDRAHFETDAFGWAIRAEHGFTWDELEGAAFKDYDPSFADTLGFGVRMGDHGRIASPGDYVKDLAAHVETQGGRMITGDVSDFVRDGGQVTGVRVGGETIACDAAVIATGVWSGPPAKKLGLNGPLECEGGQQPELWGPASLPLRHS